eukprot:scaffold4502_cov119-Isochrysis_galbana.AAC.19
MRVPTQDSGKACSRPRSRQSRGAGGTGIQASIHHPLTESGADATSGATAGKETCEIVGHGAAPEPLFTPENPGEAVRQACGRAHRGPSSSSLRPFCEFKEKEATTAETRVDLDFTSFRAPAAEVRDDLTAAGGTGGVNPASPPKVGEGEAGESERFPHPPEGEAA